MNDDVEKSDIRVWAFGNLLYFLYVRFVVFEDTNSDYTSGTVLVFLIPLVLVSTIGIFVYLTKVLKQPYSFLLQLFLAAYSGWLLMFFFQAENFPQNKAQKSLIEDDLASFQWPTSPTTTAAPQSFPLSCDRSGPVLMLTDKLKLSHFHWRIPECRRASSIQEAVYLIRTETSSLPHKSAKWIRRLSDGTVQEEGPVMVPIWTANVWNIETEELFRATLHGSISGGAAFVQNVTDSRQRMNVTTHPIDEFLTFFGIPKSRWNSFFEPEKSVLKALGW